MSSIILATRRSRGSAHLQYLADHIRFPSACSIGENARRRDDFALIFRNAAPPPFRIPAGGRSQGRHRASRYGRLPT
jgi:hypothetical protein